MNSENILLYLNVFANENEKDDKEDLKWQSKAVYRPCFFSVVNPLTTPPPLSLHSATNKSSAVTTDCTSPAYSF